MFEAFFDMTGIFAVFGPKENLLFYSNTLKIFKNGNLWRPLTPVLGKIEICAIGIFCGKFNSEQLLYEAIFDLIYSFRNILPKMNTYLLIYTHVKIIVTHSLITQTLLSHAGPPTFETLWNATCKKSFC